LTTILENRQIYKEVEQVWEDQKKIAQKLEPLQNEELRVIVELATA
jgi:hypothetical protein